LALGPTDVAIAEITAILQPQINFPGLILPARASKSGKNYCGHYNAVVDG